MAIKKTSVKKNNSTKECSSWNFCTSSQSGGCSYFLGALGAAVYYVSTATSFWAGVLGIVKALVWPAILVFEILQFLGV